jgi:hypothetical protein
LPVNYKRQQLTRGFQSSFLTPRTDKRNGAE